jgi:ribonuclease HII
MEDYNESKKMYETFKNINKKSNQISHFYTNDKIECGIDEVGRGPLFGSVCCACVILPRNKHDFKFELIKDSKKFTSKKKLNEVYQYIIHNCVDYSYHFEDEKVIDNINIREATLLCMHNCIKKLKVKPEFILVDGNYFKTYNQIPFKTIEGGDNKYSSIAAASIIAKVKRDEYIENLCSMYPELKEKYGLHKNKGYGTKQHINGIKQCGISQWHRKSFGICKTFD